MPGSSVIGNLAVNLTMETAAFTSGATQAQAQMRNVAGSAQGMARGLGAIGSTGRLTSFHMQNLAFQLNDVAVSLASGQAPMRVFMQQGAQIAQISAQAGVGIGGMARAVLALVAPFATVAAGAGLLAAAFLGVKQAADSADMQAYIDTLGLTDEQIKKLKDTTVTWGDVTQATFEVLAERAGTSSAEISNAFSRAFKGIGDFGKFSISVLAGGFAALVRFAASAANDIGLGLGKGIAFGVNKSLDFLQGLINGIVAAANKVSGFFQAIGVDFGTLNAVDLSGFHVQVTGNFTNPLKDAQAQLYSTFHAVEAGFDKISARAVQIREANLAAQAAELKAADAAGRASGGHEKNAGAVKHEADALERLRGKLDDVTAALREQEPLLTEAASAAAGFAVDNAIRAFDDQIDAEARRQQQLLGFADQFAGAIAAVATGTESLRQAFADMARSIIADIIRMTVRMLIFKAISKAFGVTADLTGGAATYDVPGMASGGSGTFGGFGGVDQNVLSLNGSPIARVSRGEHFRVSNDNAANNNVTIEQHYSFSGVAVTKDEFVQGLMFAKHDTIASIRDMNRRGRR